jgi:hypothetical protein
MEKVCSTQGIQLSVRSKKCAKEILTEKSAVMETRRLRDVGTSINLLVNDFNLKGS